MFCLKITEVYLSNKKTIEVKKVVCYITKNVMFINIINTVMRLTILVNALKQSV